MTPTNRDSEPSLRLRQQRGEKILLESTAGERDEAGDTVLATDTRGNSLTLLEEYAQRRNRVGPLQLSFSLACCAASLTFAVLLYLSTT